MTVAQIIITIKTPSFTFLTSYLLLPIPHKRLTAQSQKIRAKKAQIERVRSSNGALTLAALFDVEVAEPERAVPEAGEPEAFDTKMVLEVEPAAPVVL
jgi:hypothetical protein